MQDSFEVQENGSVTTTPGEDKKRVSYLPQILKKMHDPSTHVAEISRLITVEMAEVLREMTENRSNVDPTGFSWQKILNDQLKGLRELQKSLSEADILSKRDILNFDGPKFQFVLLEIVNLFSKALKEAGVDLAMSSNIMKQFSDLVKMNDEKLRRDTEKIAS